MITLITDFGLEDGYAGVMKGVMLTRNPAVTIVDISHMIVPQDIDMAAFVLHTSWKFFPPGTVHVVVVDPGVGTARNILAVEAGGQLFLAPDNGVLKYIFHQEHEYRVVAVDNSDLFLPNPSSTFHGRDLFAPVAAALAGGAALSALGSVYTGFIRGSVQQPVYGSSQISGEIIHFDHFGNAVTNITRDSMSGRNGLRLLVNNLPVGGLIGSYAAGSKHAAAAHIASHGYVEIFIGDGNAREILNLKTGDTVAVHWD